MRIRIGTSSSLAQRARDVEAVDLGQAEIEDHEIGSERMRLLEAVGAVGGGAHLVALHAQRALQRLGDVVVILDDEHAGGTGEVVHIRVLM